MRTGNKRHFVSVSSGRSLIIRYEMPFFQKKDTAFLYKCKDQGGK